MADQAISSITNAGLSILVARSVDASDFGAFTVAFVVFTFAIGMARAWIIEPLVIAFSGPGAATSLRTAAQECAGASLVAGVVSALTCGAVGMLVDGQVGVALRAVAVCLPAVLVHDAYRHAFFAARRPAAAAAIDFVWFLVHFSGCAVLFLTGSDSTMSILLVWGTGAAAGLLVGVQRLRGWPRPRAARRWLADHRAVGRSLGLGFLVNMGAVNAALFVVGAVAGLAAAGSLRAAQTLLGPLQVLFSALSSFALPALSRGVSEGRRDVLRPAVQMTVLVTVTASAWVVALLLLPDRWGTQVLGDSWQGARDVMPSLGAMMVLVAAVTGPGVALKSLGMASTLLRATLVQAPLILLLGTGGALWDGAEGAALGLACAHVVGGTLVWVGLQRAVRRSRDGEMTGSTFG